MKRESGPPQDLTDIAALRALRKPHSGEGGEEES